MTSRFIIWGYDVGDNQDESLEDDLEKLEEKLELLLGNEKVTVEMTDMAIRTKNLQDKSILICFEK